MPPLARMRAASIAALSMQLASCALVTNFDLSEGGGGADASTTSASTTTSSSTVGSSSSGMTAPTPWAGSIGPLDTNDSGTFFSVARGPGDGALFALRAKVGSAAPSALGVPLVPGQFYVGFADTANASPPLVHALDVATAAHIPRTLRVHPVKGAGVVARVGYTADDFTDPSLPIGVAELGSLDLQTGAYTEEVRCTSDSGLAYISAIERADGGIVVAFQQDSRTGDLECTYGGVAASCDACSRSAGVCVNPVSDTMSVVHVIDIPKTGPCTRVTLKADEGVTDEYVSAPRLAYAPNGDLVLTGFVTNRLFGGTPAEIDPIGIEQFVARFNGPVPSLPPAQASLAHPIGADGRYGAPVVAYAGGEQVLFGSTGAPSEFLVQSGPPSASIITGSGGEDAIRSAESVPEGYLVAGIVSGPSSMAPSVMDHGCGAPSTCEDAFWAILAPSTLAVVASGSYGSDTNAANGLQSASHAHLTQDRAVLFGGVYTAPFSVDGLVLPTPEVGAFGFLARTKPLP